MSDDISAREFGKLEAQVEALQNEVHQLSKDVKALLELANKGKGGFSPFPHGTSSLSVTR